MIKLVELSLTEFAAEAKLMLAYDPGKLIGEVTGNVVATLGRRLADGIKVLDGDVGSVGKGSASNEAKRLDVCGGQVVVEDLIEVVDASENLIGYAGRDDAVIDDGDVLHVDGSFFVVGEELRSDGSYLVALTDEPVGAEVVLVAETIVDLSEAVPAVTKLGIAGVIVQLRAYGVLREDVGSP